MSSEKVEGRRLLPLKVAYRESTPSAQRAIVYGGERYQPIRDVMTSRVCCRFLCDSTAV